MGSGNQSLDLDVGANALRERAAKAREENRAAAQRAAKFRADRRLGTQGKNIAGNKDASNNNESSEPSTLREATMAALKRESLKDKAVAVATAPVRRGTSKLLQQAWLNLVDSYGLTLIWIDIHVWLGSIFGNEFFCKLGAEWVDDNIKAAQTDYNKSQGGIIGTVEPMVLAGCNLGCLFILIFLISLVAMMLKVVDNPLEVIKTILKIFWGALSGSK